MTYFISTDTGEEYEADSIVRAFLGEMPYIPARQGSIVYFLNPGHIVSIKKAEPVDRSKAKGEHFWGDWHDRVREASGQGGGGGMNGIICSVGTIADHVTLARVDRGIRINVTADGRTSTTVVTRKGAEAMRDALIKVLEGWE